MRLAIVGNTCLRGNQQAHNAVKLVIAHFQPTLIISGGAIGVDTMAKDEADAIGIPTDIKLPRVNRWDGPHGYKARNIEIAENCDALVRIWSPRSLTYGSGWTADYADFIGKPTVSIEIH